jgi:hypothetical protein
MNVRLLLLASISLASASASVAACDGPVLWSGPDDGGSLRDANGLDANPSTLDAGVDGSDATLDGSAAGDGSCESIAWPAMLAASITPLQTVANLNMNQSGPSAVTLAYGETVNCPATVFDGGNLPGSVAAAWGPANDVSFMYDVAAPNLFYTLEVSGAYTGTLSFHSRAGGAYGDHSYLIGVNQLLRDGTPFTIDWTGSSATVVTAASIGSVNELFDAMMATFAPTYPVETDCYDSQDCIIVPNEDPDEDAGTPAYAVFGVRPLKIYVETLINTSVPHDLYFIFTAGPDLSYSANGDDAGTDAGPLPGMDAGGGVNVPAGCEYSSGDLRGSCGAPTSPLCQAGFVPYSCRDYPQSGYIATCCPGDGG